MDAAIAANRQGRYADAEADLQNARQEAERFGPDDPRVASTLKSLVTLYYSQGRFTEAEPLQRRARAIDEKALGAKDSSVADTLTNLAALYLRQGRYAEAARIFERALGEWERAVGPDDPRVASALNVVAEVLRAQGKYAEAEPLVQRSLAIVERAFGRDSPGVSNNLQSLATLYARQGKPEAESMFVRLLENQERALGPNHSKVAATLEEYARLLRNMNRSAEADTLEARAKSIRAKQAK